MTVELADPARVVIERRVEWPDTDADGHQHHSVVMRWVEEAEAALLEPASGEVTVVHTGTSSTGAVEWPAQTRTALAGAGRQSTTCCSVDEGHNHNI